jgi:hypothetical protein
VIYGIQTLIAMRKAGKRPNSLWVNVGIPYRKPVYAGDFADMELVAVGSLATDDFRAFIGLDVTLYSPEDCKTFLDLIEKMKGYASRLLVLCGEYGIDLGYEWHPLWGQHDIGEIRWAEQFEYARTSICRTKKETDERIRLENEALEKAPWILTLKGGANGAHTQS